MRRSATKYQKALADLWIEVDTYDSKVFGTEEEIKFCEEQGYKVVMDLAKQGYFDENKMNI